MAEHFSAEWFTIIFYNYYFRTARVIDIYVKDKEGIVKQVQKIRKSPSGLILRQSDTFKI